MDQIALFWDAKQGDLGDVWHRTLIHPGVWRVLGDVAGKRVLDLACGNGSLARQMARRRANVIGADSSAPIIALARQREAREPLGIAYHAADASRLGALADGSFDVVVTVMALMDMPDGTAQGALREAARALRPGGKLVACISHPCFDQGMDSAWVLERRWGERRVWRKVARYREHHELLPYWRGEDGERFFTVSYHRPLGWYVRAIASAGLVVTGVEEPAPTPEMAREDEDAPLIAEIPLHIVFEAMRPPAT